MKKPITPAQHGAIDYAFLAIMVTAPTLLRLTPRTRVLFGLFGAIQGSLNAFTDQPLSLKPLVSFRTHGLVEKSSGPLYLLAPILLGITKTRRERTFWLSLGAVLTTVYNLTDWNATRIDR